MPRGLAFVVNVLVLLTTSWGWAPADALLPRDNRRRGSLWCAGAAAFSVPGGGGGGGGGGCTSVVQSIPPRRNHGIGGQRWHPRDGQQRRGGGLVRLETRGLASSDEGRRRFSSSSSSSSSRTGFDRVEGCVHAADPDIAPVSAVAARRRDERDESCVARFASALHEALTASGEGAQPQPRDGPEASQGKKGEEKAKAPPIFESLTIEFVGTKRVRKSPSSPPVVPGSLKRVTGRLVALPNQTKKKNNKKVSSTSSGSSYVLHVTHKYHGATDIVKNYPVESAAPSLQELLTWVLARMNRTTDNGDNDEAELVVPGGVTSIATEWGISNLVPFSASVRGRIDTADGTRYVLTLDPGTSSRGSSSSSSFRRVVPSPSTTTTTLGAITRTSTTDPLRLGHDAPKNRKVQIEDEFWRAVGVATTASASTAVVKPDRIGKIKQCEKFVEIVSQLLRDVTNEDHVGDDDAASSGRLSIRITDLGCGKGYLTYALHAYLQQQPLYGNVTSTGIDVRPKLVHELTQIASNLKIDGLRFEPGSIQDACLADDNDVDGVQNNSATDGSTGDADVQVFIALHACDTATDDALYSAIRKGADVIVTAPCCHKQLRFQINDLMLGSGPRRRSSTTKDAHPLSDVLRHGIYRERTAETVTDSLRALLMELAGYETNVFEFVGGEHTAKNCMITGIRRRRDDTNQRSSARDDRDAVRQRIRTLAEFCGIRAHKLADWMGEQALLVPRTHEGTTDPSLRRSIRAMPPLQPKD